MIRKAKTYCRGGKIYIDARLECGRKRFSSGLEWNDENLFKIKNEMEHFIYKALRGDIVLPKVCEYNFDSLGAQFLEKCNKNLKASTLEAYRSQIKNLQAFFKKDVRLISMRDFERFFEEKPKKYLKMINRLLDVAREQNIDVPKLKSAQFSFAQTQAREIMPFSLKEAQLMIQNAQGSLKNYLCVAFFTGMRVGEILALRESDCDFAQNKITINKTFDRGKITPPKTKSSNRKIDMLPLVKEALSAQKCLSGERLFTLSRVELTGLYKALLHKCGLKNRVLYNTRHSFASIMLSHGEEPLWVAAMMGHKNLNVTYEFYAKFIPNERLRAGFIDFNLNGGEI